MVEFAGRSRVVNALQRFICLREANKSEQGVDVMLIESFTEILANHFIEHNPQTTEAMQQAQRWVDLWMKEDTILQGKDSLW